MTTRPCGLTQAEREIIIGAFGFLIVFPAALLLPAAQVSSRSSQAAGPSAAAQPLTTLPQEVSGRVIDPNGRPAAGAQVTLAVRYCRVMLHNGVLAKSLFEEPESPDQLVETDGEGRFHFAGQRAHPFYLLAAHASGFVAANGKEFEEDREIQLKGWGRIEGEVAQGRGGPDHRVWMVGLPRPAWVGHQCDVVYDAPCDADGRFVFEKVPAGWFNVGYLMAIEEHTDALTARTAVAVKAGATARVKIGGGGRPVIGRFVPPASYGRSVDFGLSHTILHRNEGIERDERKAQQLFDQQPRDDPYGADVDPEDPRTDNCLMVTGVTDGSLRDWCALQCGTDRPAHLADNDIWGDVNWRGYTFRINPNGSFRIEDVVPGRYDLSISLTKRGAGEGEWPWRFAQYRGTIEVPSVAEPRTNRPLDLGALTLDVFGVGDFAPLFESMTVDDKLIRLVDYRGRFVLLAFSAPDRPEDLLHLKQLQRTYGSGGGFQIIERLSECGRQTAQRYVADHEVEWPVTYSGFPDRLLEQYHLEVFPSAVLIDPEGKVIATRLEGERLMNAVRDALKRVPPAAPKDGKR